MSGTATYGGSRRCCKLKSFSASTFPCASESLTKKNSIIKDGAASAISHRDGHSLRTANKRVKKNFAWLCLHPCGGAAVWVAEECAETLNLNGNVNVTDRHDGRRDERVNTLNEWYSDNQVALDHGILVAAWENPCN